MSDENHTTTVSDSAKAAATITEMYAAAARLRAFLDAPPATAGRSGVAFTTICLEACRVRDAVDAGTSSMAVAHTGAVGDVRRNALGEAADDSDSAIADALGRMVYEDLACPRRRGHPRSPRGGAGRPVAPVAARGQP